MDATVHDTMASLFRGLTSTTKCRGALYIWRYEDFGGLQSAMVGPRVSSPKEFTDAVHEAIQDSGATDVKFIVDVKYWTLATAAAFASLGLNVTFDTRSADPDADDIMHSKFFTFSRLEFTGNKPAGFPDQMRDVVVVGSANVDNAMYQAANNVIVMYDNRPLYEAFVDLWEYIHSNPRARKADAVTKDCGDVVLYSFPRATDEIVAVLENLRASMDSTATGPTVRVAMYLLSRTAVRNELIELAQAGADVKVVLTSHGHTGDPENRAVHDELENGGVGARLLPNRKTGVMHSKYLIIDGQYRMPVTVKFVTPRQISSPGPRERVKAGLSRRRLVWTGSHNYTGDALEENDEVLVRLADPKVVAGYFTDWERLWQLAGS
jgi:phosphatidylserine/phosphatidylglycerophosphate/cardiolipin synthase-like enzyme